MNAMRVLTVIGFALPAMAQSGIEGTVLDRTGGLVAGARVMLMEDFVKKTETVSDAQGRFAFKGVGMGVYNLLVKRDGFALYHRPAVVKEDQITRVNALLSADRMSESVTVSNRSEAAGKPTAPAMRRAGGKLDWPKALRPLRPRYPEKAALAGIQGAVVAVVRIQPDGAAEVVAVVESPDAELEAEVRRAVGAVRYTPMSLNGQPVECESEVKVEFRLAER